jgi:hypothetical protein
MKQKTLLILCLLVNISALFLISPTITALADPTPTPRMFSKTDLLNRLLPKPFATFSQHIPFNSGAPGDSVIDGGGWLTTYLAIYGPFNILGTLFGIAIVLLIAFWITRKLTTLIRKRPMSPAEAYFRTNYKEYRESAISKGARHGGGGGRSGGGLSGRKAVKSGPIAGWGFKGGRKR